ncbi:MAG: carbohydrate-binding protein, partial [Mucilaginibacter sp.]
SGEGRCVQFEANDYITFDDINLKGISLLGLRMQKLTNKNVVLEVHADSKDGPLIGTVTMPDGKGYKDIDMAVKDPGRLHDLVFIVKGEAENVLLSLSWMEFKAGK